MKKGLIIASFGTTDIETRKKSIENIENGLKEAFPSYETVRCFTSRQVKRKIELREDKVIYNEIEALDALKEKGIAEEDIFIQPLHMIPGVEYEKLLKLGVKVGQPLLYDKESIEKVVSLLDYPDPEEGNLVLFGHGTYHESDWYYQGLQEALDRAGKQNVYMITVEGQRTIEDILEKLIASKKKVILKPFMIVAGVHARMDMASDDESSVRSIIESHGLETEVLMEGLGEDPKIVEEFILRGKDLLGE